MTEENDNLIEDDSAVVNAALEEASYEGESDDELMDDGEGMSSEEFVDSDDDEESLDGDLTPNDIFGLDPLDVLTLEELAEYLKVSPAAARRVIKEQNLPGKNIGGEWRFLRDAVANWLRGQDAPAVQQQKARTEFAKVPAPAPAPAEDAGQREQYSRPPRRPFQADQQGGPTEYRPRQRFPEGGGQYGGQQGGQYGGGGGGQYGGGGQGQYGGGGGGGGQYGSYSRPPRRQFGSTEGGNTGGGGYGNRDAAGGGGYGGGAQGGQFSGGGYGGGAGGGQRFGGAASGGAKRKNKRQVFDDQRGKRLDRRKDGDVAE
ncbi:helix-turn-helix domain-containing protein [Schlesneria paludicola]|uniref:helix-turn-helix domain-containing protein n=1 Tax=Schlesneria paludicola TaxID=360056 RepID=UPI0002FBF785|nr:helix-turn-helix domain-containing protein [Schlesneria paludicola]